MKPEATSPVWPSDLRRTRCRKYLLQALTEATGPLTVLQLEERTNRLSPAPIWPSTLYRALETFLDHDMVNKTLLPDGHGAVYELNRHGSRHYAFCIGCSKMIPVEHCPVVQESTKLADDGFVITGHTLEVFGYCRSCRQQKEVTRK